MINIVLRDDDLNYYTSVNDLKLAYGDYLGKIPISFATVPFIHKSMTVMAKLSGSCNVEKIKHIIDYEDDLGLDDFQNYFMNYKPIGENVELISFLSELISTKKVDILLHGITHRFYPDGAEMLNNHVPYYYVNQSKKYLENLFNYRLKYFVPPSNKLSVSYFNELCKCDLAVLTSQNLIPETFNEAIKMVFNTLFNSEYVVRKLKRLRTYKRIISNNNIILSPTFKIEDTSETYLKRNIKDFESNGFGVISTHYMNHFDDTYKNEFFKLIKFFESNDKYRIIRMSDLLY